MIARVTDARHREIIRSQFVFDENYDPISGSVDSLYGADLENCRDFIIEENDFINTSNEINTLGLQILNGGPYAHEVYNNYFEGLCTGISAVGVNRDYSDGVGLCIKCNDFNECVTDIYVTPEFDGNEPILPSDQKIGIALKQGLPNTGGSNPDSTIAAGNTFTVNPDKLNINNHPDYCEAIIYTYHNVSTAAKKVRPNPVTSNVDRQEDQYAHYIKEVACPSKLQGGGGIDPLAEKNNLDLQYENISAFNDTLDLMVDGGDTETLNMEVQTSFPNEAMQVRQQLLDESPYLSDTIMKSAINKENVLPNAMIRDILVANPQSAKTPDVVNYLDTRFNPMPDYMMNEIMQGLSVEGAKEIYHNKIAYHKSMRMNSLVKLEKLYRYDTVDASKAQDSLIALWHREPYPDAWYKLAFQYLKNEDSVLLFNTLDSIPMQFELSSSEVYIHSQYIDLINLLWSIQGDTNGIDSTEIQSLILISENRSIPGRIAMNLLNNEEILIYSESIYLPDQLKEYEELNPELPVKHQNTFINIFPNPAQEYFIIEYTVPDKHSNASIELISYNGRNNKRISLNGLNNQEVVSTYDLSNGVYLIKLYGDNQLIEVRKIIISK